MSGIVLVKNSSGADRDRFDILGIDGPIIAPTDNPDEFKNRVTIDGITPAMADHTGQFVILAEPIASGAIGRGHLDGALEHSDLVPQCQVLRGQRSSAGTETSEKHKQGRDDIHFTVPRSVARDTLPRGWLRGKERKSFREKDDGVFGRDRS